MSRAERWESLVDLLADCEIDEVEFRLEAAGDYAKKKIDEAIKAHQDVLDVARAIAEKGFGRPWDDFLPVNAKDTDQQDLVRYARAAITGMVGLPDVPKGFTALRVDEWNSLALVPDGNADAIRAILKSAREVRKHMFVPARLNPIRCKWCGYDARNIERHTLALTGKSRATPEAE